VRVVQSPVGDTSDGFFTIVERDITADIRVLSPNDASIVWREGTEATVTWSSANITAVDISLSTDGGASWSQTLAQNTPATPSSFAFRVPHYADTNLTSLLLRVSNSDGGTPFDYSDAPFGFRPTVATIGAPGDGTFLSIAGVASPPWSDHAAIVWHTRSGGETVLRVADSRGNVVRILRLGYAGPGAHRSMVDLSGLLSGGYRAEIRCGAWGASVGIIR
jgi:hypothetical protein